MKKCYSSPIRKLVCKIEILRKQLKQLAITSSIDFSNKKYSLHKQYECCLKKLATLITPAIKAGTVLGLSTILNTSAGAQQQPCSTFHNTVYSNPIKRVPLPYQGLGKPFFVDIDGDGDLDCYEEYYDLFGTSTHIGNIVFLRNEGTKEIPYFVQDTANGFPSTLALDLGPYPFEMDGAVFADMDGDGDYDCILGSYFSCCGQKIIYFENTGTKTKPVFTERDGAANPFSFFYGYYGLSYALADLDSDGDYDLIATNYAYTTIYTNIGTAKTPKFKETQSTLDHFSGHVNVYDWNKDGLTDYFNSGFYYKNIGTVQNAVFQISGQGPHLPSNFYMYQFADINNDGFPEVFDFYGNLATTSPDAAIKADSVNKILQAYPKGSAFTYHWQRNGKQIPNATTDHFIPKITGFYTVEITGSCGTGVSYPYAFKTTQKTLTGENEDSYLAPQIVANKLLSDGSVKTFPNPFTNTFQLQLGNSYMAGKTSVRITDVQGRIMQTIEANSHEITLGSSLSKGIYMVQVISNNAVVYTGKIVKE